MKDYSSAGLKEVNRNKLIKISEIRINNFRNYKNYQIKSEMKEIVLTGKNGSGKTNLMEAISMLAPGRGLRRAKKSELINKNVNNKNFNANDWSVYAKVNHELKLTSIGTGSLNSENLNSRIIKIDGYKTTQQELEKILFISWLTPQMDGLFIGSSINRRRFIDRLATSFDDKHTGRLTKYNRAWSQRNYLIVERKKEESWFISLEKILAETGVAIIATRLALIEELNKVSNSKKSSFPSFNGFFSGYASDLLNSGIPAVDVEDEIMANAKTNRYNNNFSMYGPHESDLIVKYNNLTADQCSTGEQKALLISLILSHSNLLEHRLGKAPILLLDDVVSHLDNNRREELFDICSEIHSQIWYSGTDENFFKTINKTAQFVNISSQN